MTLWSQARRVCVLSLAVVMMGCAAGPRVVVYQAPVPVQLADEAVPRVSGDRVGAPAILATAHSISGTAPIAYFQTHGGGGVGVGLALGPLGVLANAKMIKAETESNVAGLMNKLALDPVAMLSAIAGAPQAAPSDLVLHPAVLVMRGDNNRLYLASIVDARQPSWGGRYVHHLSQTLDLDAAMAGLDAAAMAGLQEQVSEGFASAYQLFKDDAAGRLVAGAEVTFYSEALSPRFKFMTTARRISESGNRIVVLGPGAAAEIGQHTVAGYHSFDRSQMEFQK